MRRNIQITAFALAFMTGVILAANFSFAFSWWQLIAGAAIFSSTLVFKSKLGYVAIVAAGLLFGIARYEFWFSHQPVTVDALTDQKVSITGTVVGEPSWDQYHMYVFYIDGVSKDSQSYIGLIRVKIVSGQIREGQTVQITGKAKAGLGKASVLISYADAKIVSQNSSFLITTKNNFLSGLNNSLSHDSAAFVAGTLIGSRSALSKNIQDLLSTVGLSHVIAVSGYNLTILIAMLSYVLGKKWRWGSLVVSLWVILGFVLISGANAAIVRAGVMSTIFLVARFYGRRVSVVVCMALAGLGMVALNPANLISDIGWQLSFASLLGIAVLAPRIAKILPKKPSWLHEILSVTLAAQLATAGIIAYNFGSLSLIAPFVNCIVMPLIPIIMAYGAIVAFLGMILPNIAGLLGRPLDAVVSILFDFLHYMQHFSWASIEIPALSVAAVTLYYGVLCLWIFLGRSTDLEDLPTEEDHGTIANILTLGSKQELVKKGAQNVRPQ